MSTHKICFSTKITKKKNYLWKILLSGSMVIVIGFIVICMSLFSIHFFSVIERHCLLLDTNNASKSIIHTNSSCYWI